MPLSEPSIETVKKISAFILNRRSDELRKELYNFLVMLILSDEIKEGLTFSNIVNLIKKELKLSYISESMIKEAINRLVDEKIIYEGKIDKKILLSDEYNTRITNYKIQYNSLVDNVNENIKNKLKNEFKDFNNDDIDLIKKIFDMFLAILFNNMSIEACSIILNTREGKIDKIDAVNILNNLLSEYPYKDKIYKIKEILLTYLYEPDDYLKNYLFALAQTYFAIGVLQLDPDCNLYTKESLKEKNIYLDTNVIIHSLVKSDKRSEATNYALKLSNNLGIKLIITKETIREYEKLIKHKKTDLQKIKKIPDSRYEKIADELELGIVKDYFETKKIKPSLTADSYFTRLEEYDTILSSLFKVQFDSGDNSYVYKLKEFDDAKKCVQYAAEFKSENTVIHDAFHILLIQQLRKANPSDVLGPKYWFLTNDTSLNNAEKCLDDAINSNVQCSTWIQILTPFVAPIHENNSREAFVSFFSSRLPVASNLIDENDFLMLQGDWIDDRDLDGKDVAKIIGNRYVKSYLKIIKEENKPIREEDLSKALNPVIQEIKRSKSNIEQTQKTITELTERTSSLEEDLFKYKSIISNFKYVLSSIIWFITFLVMYNYILINDTNRLWGSVIVALIIGYLLGFPGYKWLLEKIFSLKISKQ
jgi:predicted nucleic acid-binding protein